MARPLRIECSRAVYRVMFRGNERKAIVRDEADREKRLDCLRRTVEIYGGRLHAFVLMRNHDHLFVETPAPNRSARMQYCNGGETSYFNRRRRSGHQFQGRFKAHGMATEGCFLKVSGDIHWNPVRAKIVARPEEYPWSSYQGYIWASWTLPWVTYARALSEFGRNVRGARRAYARFVQAGIEQPPPSPFAGALGGLLVGSERFVAKMRGVLRDRPDEDALPDVARSGDRPQRWCLARLAGRWRSAPVDPLEAATIVGDDHG